MPDTEDLGEERFTGLMTDLSSVSDSNLGKIVGFLTSEKCQKEVATI